MDALTDRLKEEIKILHERMGKDAKRLAFIRQELPRALNGQSELLTLSHLADVGIFFDSRF